MVIGLLPISSVSSKINISCQTIIELRKSFFVRFGLDVYEDKCDGWGEGDGGRLISLRSLENVKWPNVVKCPPQISTNSSLREGEDYTANGLRPCFAFMMSYYKMYNSTTAI